MLTVLNVAYPFAPVGRDAVGGAEQVVTLLDSGVCSAGHQSLVIACEGSKTRGILLPIPLAPGPISEVTRRASADRCRRAIQAALTAYPIDIVHCHGIDCFSYLPAAGVPVLVTLHLPLSWYPAALFKVKRPGTFLHCVSQTQAQTAPAEAALLPPIENGVPECLFRTRHAKRGFALSLGRICPEKGFHIALKASRQAELPLLLGGQVFPYPDHLEYFSREILPNLDPLRRFIGPVGFVRKRRLLAAARCLVVPSMVPETSSLVAMEALACGTPVVAFAAGALTEMIDHGRTGFLVNSANELGEAMKATDRLDPKDCREIAQKRFSQKRMVEQYLALYSKLTRDCPRVRSNRYPLEERETSPRNPDCHGAFRYA